MNETQYKNFAIHQPTSSRCRIVRNNHAHVADINSISKGLYFGFGCDETFKLDYDRFWDIESKTSPNLILHAYHNFERVHKWAESARNKLIKKFDIKRNFSD